MATKPTSFESTAKARVGLCEDCSNPGVLPIGLEDGRLILLCVHHAQQLRRLEGDE